MSLFVKKILYDSTWKLVSAKKKYKINPRICKSERGRGLFTALYSPFNSDKHKKACHSSPTDDRILCGFFQSCKRSSLIPWILHWPIICSVLSELNHLLPITESLVPHHQLLVDRHSGCCPLSIVLLFNPKDIFLCRDWFVPGVAY